MTATDPTMPAVRDDLATIEYHRGAPLPPRPTLLAPEPRPPTPRSPPGPAPLTSLPRPTPLTPLPRPGTSAMQIAPRPGTPPAWSQPAACTTCPFRQPPDRTLVLPDAQTPLDPTPPRSPQGPTATQLRPSQSGSTTVLQAVAPPPPAKRMVLPLPPPRRSPLVYVQLGLWLVIAAGLLILAVRQLQ